MATAFSGRKSLRFQSSPTGRVIHGALQQSSSGERSSPSHSGHHVVAQAVMRRLRGGGGPPSEHSSVRWKLHRYSASPPVASHISYIRVRLGWYSMPVLDRVSCRRRWMTSSQHPPSTQPQESTHLHSPTRPEPGRETTRASPATIGM